MTSRAPSVEITYPPKDGPPLSSDEILVALTVRGFTLVDDTSAAPKDGEGRIVYYLDADRMPASGDATDVGGGARAESATTTSHTWTDVGAGRHTIGVQLVHNDGTPLDPPATDGPRVVATG